MLLKISYLANQALDADRVLPEVKIFLQHLKQNQYIEADYFLRQIRKNEPASRVNPALIHS